MLVFKKSPISCIIKFTFFAVITLALLGVHGYTGTPEGCPAPDQRSRQIVTNFLSEPDLSDAREEIGIEGVSASQVSVVSNESTCNEISEEYVSSEYSDYRITYYRASNVYFAVLVLKQPEVEDRVVVGLSMIDVYNSDLEFMKGYAG